MHHAAGQTVPQPGSFQKVLSGQSGALLTERKKIKTLFSSCDTEQQYTSVQASSVYCFPVKHPILWMVFINFSPF